MNAAQVKHSPISPCWHCDGWATSRCSIASGSRANMTVYDGAYVALAERASAPLVT